MYEFDRCHIVNKSGKAVASGYVLECKAGTIKIHTKEPPLLYPGEAVTIFILNNQKGRCRYRAEVLDIQETSSVYVNAVFLSSIQKRSNTRVNRQMRFTVRNRIENGKEEPLKKPIEITMLNISAQGMYFNCDENLNIGFTFPIEFKETRRPVHLTVKVIRKEEYTRSRNYGCFFDISQRDMDEIYRFVLKEQIEQRRKKIIF